MDPLSKLKSKYQRGSLPNHIEFDSGRPHSTEGGNGVLFRGKLHHSSHANGSPFRYSYVAVKQIRRKGDDDDDEVKAKCVRNVTNEASIWEGVHHANLLRFLGIMCEDDEIYLISPFAPHGSLSNYIRANPNANRLLIIWQIAAGITHLHSQGIGHGDIKGLNVVMFDGPTAKICDFGLSKLIDGNESTTPLWSLPWTSPERWTGEPRSFESDVYAFGITIYEILSGENPFFGTLRNENYYQRICKGEERPPTNIGLSPTGIPYALIWELAKRCWRTAPEERPAMKDVCDDLARMEGVAGLTVVNELDDLPVYELPQGPRIAAAFAVSENAHQIESLPRAKTASHDARRTNALAACLHGTRVAVIQEIHGWATAMNPDSPSVFWLNGTAGTGKSTLAKTLSKYAEGEGILGATFFFSRQGDAEIQSSRLVIPTIAFQITQAIDSFKRNLASVLRQNPGAALRDQRSQLELLLAAPLRAIGRQRPLVLVLDALDECEVDEAVKLLQLLFEFLSRPDTSPSLKLFITTRSPEPKLESILHKAEMARSLCLDDVQHGDADADIERYLQQGLTKPPPDPSLPSDWVSVAELQQLSRICGHRFIHASRLLEYICDDSDLPRNRLQSVLDGIYGASENGMAHLEELCEMEPHYRNLGPV